MFALLAELSPAQNQSPVALDTSETLFTVLTAINTCGYDQELGVSDPLRSRVRSEVAEARQSFAGGQRRDPGDVPVLSRSTSSRMPQERWPSTSRWRST